MYFIVFSQLASQLKKVLSISYEIQKVLTDVTRGVPIVSLRQQRTELLGPPYSEPGFQIDDAFLIILSSRTAFLSVRPLLSASKNLPSCFIIPHTRKTNAFTNVWYIMNKLHQKLPIRYG